MFIVDNVTVKLKLLIKLTCLLQVEELIIRKEPTLLDNFLDVSLSNCYKVLTDFSTATTYSCTFV